MDQALGEGQSVEIAWYGCQLKTMRVLTDVCLWHVAGSPPVKLRWVLVVDPDGQYRPQACFSTDTTLTLQAIVEGFVLRWGVEVTFEESRRHLGVETQRQWSDLAIARTTPVLLGLFSLACLMAQRLTADQPLLPRATAWYLKTEVTFSDMLARVRRAIWAGRYFDPSRLPADPILIPCDDCQLLMDQLASTA